VRGSSWLQGKDDITRLHGGAAPEAKGSVFVGNDGDAPGNGAPFSDEDKPGLQGRVGTERTGGRAGSACGVEIGSSVKDKRAKEAQVADGLRAKMPCWPLAFQRVMRSLSSGGP